MKSIIIILILLFIGCSKKIEIPTPISSEIERQNTFTNDAMLNSWSNWDSLEQILLSNKPIDYKVIIEQSVIAPDDFIGDSDYHIRSELRIEAEIPLKYLWESKIRSRKDIDGNDLHHIVGDMVWPYSKYTLIIKNKTTDRNEVPTILSNKMDYLTKYQNMFKADYKLAINRLIKLIKAEIQYDEYRKQRDSEKKKKDEWEGYRREVE